MESLRASYRSKTKPGLGQRRVMLPEAPFAPEVWKPRINANAGTGRDQDSIGIPNQFGCAFYFGTNIANLCHGDFFILCPIKVALVEG
jgi:hypothetical protein